MASTQVRPLDAAGASNRRRPLGEPRTDAVLRRALMVMFALAALTLPFGRSATDSMTVFIASEALMGGLLVALWRRRVSPLVVMWCATAGVMVLMTAGVDTTAGALAAGGDAPLGMRLVAYGTIVSGLSMLVLGATRGAAVSVVTQVVWGGMVVSRLGADSTLVASEGWLASRYNVLILVLLWGVLRTNALLRAERDRLRAAADRERLRGQQRQQQEERLGRELAEAAHELRAPLSTIAAGTETLASWGDELDGTARGQVLETLRHASARLDRRTAALLATARDPSADGPLHRERVDVREVLSTTLEDLELLTSGHDVRLDVPHGSVGYLDPDGLDHITTNLVQNATKYVPPGGRIEVSIRRDGDTTVLVVADDGPGVPAASRQHLFTPYVRAPHAGAVEGTGVGLAVVRSWSRRHGGDVSLLATAAGAAFEVRLPDGPQR